MDYISNVVNSEIDVDQIRTILVQGDATYPHIQFVLDPSLSGLSWRVRGYYRDFNIAVLSDEITPTETETEITVDWYVSTDFTTYYGEMQLVLVGTDALGTTVVKALGNVIIGRDFSISTTQVITENLFEQLMAQLASACLKLDQSTPQTFVGGIPKLAANRVIDHDNDIVDKKHVADVVATVTADDFNHNDLANKQGGSAGEYYHMTQAQNTALHAHSNKTALDAVSGTNTGDQVLPTRNSLGLDTDDTVTFANLSGTNTGDQDVSGAISTHNTDAGAHATEFGAVDGRLDSLEGDVTELQNTGVDTTARGDITTITGNTIIKYTSGYIVTNGATINPTASASATYMYAVLNCVAGAAFTITGTGGSTPRLWAFADSSWNVLTVEISSATRFETVIYAPKNAAHLVSNVNNTFAYLLCQGRLLRTEPNRNGEYAVKDYIAKRIVVDASGGGDYTTITAACAALTDGAANNQYEVAVMPGTYNVNNMTVPAFTHIHGIAPNTVIVTSEGGTATLSMFEQKTNSSKLSNMKIISYTKYCIHFDTALDGKTIVNENLWLKKAVYDAIIGGGTYEYGTLDVFKNCIFENGDVACHTNANANYENSHVVFDNCRFINAYLSFGSVGGFGHCVGEIRNCQTKKGVTTVLLGASTIRNINVPQTYMANGCEWQILGSNNKNFLPEFTINFKGLMFETANIGEAISITGTAVAALFGTVKYKAGGARTKGLATGLYRVEDVQAGLPPYTTLTDVFQMWKRLGDCSSVNKTLSVTVGATTQSYTFNQNYLTAKTAETTLLSAINAVITVATLKENTVTEAWANLNVDEKQYVTITDIGDVLAGEWVTIAGARCSAESAISDVYGIALQSGIVGEAISVWVGNVFRVTGADGEYGMGAHGILSSSATLKIGKIQSGIFYRY